MPPAASTAERRLCAQRPHGDQARWQADARGRDAWQAQSSPWDQAVKYAVDHLHQPLAEALRMASLYPAQFLRLDRDRGRIAPGFVADMVLLADDLAVQERVDRRRQRVRCAR